MKHRIGFALFAAMLSGMFLQTNPVKAQTYEGTPVIFFYETDRTATSMTIDMKARIHSTNKYKIEFNKGCHEISPGKYEKILYVSQTGQTPYPDFYVEQFPGSCVMNKLIVGENTIIVKAVYVENGPELTDPAVIEEKQKLFSSQFVFTYPYLDKAPTELTGFSGSVEQREVNTINKQIFVEHQAMVMGSEKKFDLQFAPDCVKVREGYYTRALKVKAVRLSSHPVETASGWKSCVLENPVIGENIVEIIPTYEGVNEYADWRIAEASLRFNKKFTVSFVKPAFDRTAKSEITVIEHSPNAVVAEIKSSIYDFKTYSFVFDTCVEKEQFKYLQIVTVTQGHEYAHPQQSWRRNGNCRITNPANGIYTVEVQTVFAGTWNNEEKIFVQKGLNISYPITVNYAVSPLPPQTDEIVENDVSEDAVDLTVKVTNVRYVSVRSRRTGQVYKRYLVDLAVTNNGDAMMSKPTRLSYKSSKEKKASTVALAEGLSPGETRKIQVFFTKESRGANAIFTIDPQNAIAESNEQNNNAEAVIQKWR